MWCGLASNSIAASRRAHAQFGATGSCDSWSVFFWIGTFFGSLVILLSWADFVPVVRGWLRDEVDGWSDVVRCAWGRLVLR